MLGKQLLATKSLEQLEAEGKGENRLRRVLGKVGLSSLGIGAIIGAGIFVMTGRVAAQDAGPAIMLSFVVAGLGCLFAALCYAEFASMAPVAGSAYTYAYATLGEIFAWVIGWDLVLEYAMSCACVASSWSKYLNVFLKTLTGWEVPRYLCNDPFSTPGAYVNLPAMLITLLCTVVLVIGIRESATTNAILVAIKIGVVLFVIGAGIAYVDPYNWTSIPVRERLTPEERLIADEASDVVAEVEGLKGLKAKEREEALADMALAQYMVEHREKVLEEVRGNPAEEARAEKLLEEARAKYGKDLPKTPEDRKSVAEVLRRARAKGPEKSTERWGLLGLLGFKSKLERIDDAVRSPFMPYGLAGVIFGASIVFFAYIGFDSISTHAEEARRPQRDVPIAILASLVICTALYIAVAAIITGMMPYPEIHREAAVAEAFRQKAAAGGNTRLLNAAAWLIATGALAGMTSVILITFLSQARIFLAMARDKLLPPSVFGAVHQRFKTPHVSTLLTGGIISVVAAITPITKLEEMVNIGTLMAFVIVCAAVLMLRVRRPEAHRPFRAPWLFVVAPLGILVNVIMMLFLPLDTWVRLVVWLVIGMFIYFGYGVWHSTIGRQLRGLEPAFPGGVPPAPGDKVAMTPPSEGVQRPGPFTPGTP